MIEIPDKEYEQLRDSEERYRTLVKTSPDAVTVSDLEGNITEVSRKTLELHGFNNDQELIGRSAFELIAPEDHLKARSNLQKTLEKGQIGSTELILLRKDGSRFIGELNASMIKGPEGKPRGFIATTRDITDRKQILKALRKSEDLYRTLAESSQDMIFIVDKETKLHYVNNYAAAKFGLTPEKVVGKSLDQFFPTNVFERAKWDIQRVFDSGQPFASESMLLLPDNQLWLETQLIPLKDFCGNHQLVLGIARDMTKYKTAEDRLREKLKNLEEFNQAAVTKELRLIELEKEIDRLKKLTA